MQDRLQQHGAAGASTDPWTAGTDSTSKVEEPKIMMWDQRDGYTEVFWVCKVVKAGGRGRREIRSR